MRTIPGAALTLAAVLTIAGGAAGMTGNAPAAVAAPMIDQGGYPMEPAPMPAISPYSYPIMPAPMVMPMPMLATPAIVSAPAASNTMTTAAGRVSIADFAFSPASITVHVGDSVTWTNSDSVPHTTTSDTEIWNSGALQPGASFSHTFTSAGSFAYHCMIHPFMTGTVIVQPAGAAAPAAAPVPSPAPTTAVAAPSQAAGVQVSYAAGWNLVAGSAGAILAQDDGPLYSLRSGDTDYEVLASGTPLIAGTGYWAFFDTPTSETLPAGNPQPAVLQLPAGQFVMIGNPGTVPTTVSGADAVFTYDPVKGYQSTTMLQPGQGAWAFSAAGAQIMLSSAPNGG